MNCDRVRNREALVPLIAGVMRGRKVRDWLEALESVDVPCGPINDIDQVFADPHLVARNLRFDLPHPLAGSVPQVGAPIRMSETPLTARSAAPLLAQHTSSVLRDFLGITGDRLAALAAAGVVEIRDVPLRREP